MGVGKSLCSPLGPIQDQSVSARMRRSYCSDTFSSRAGRWGQGGLHPSDQIHIINSQSGVAGCTAYREGGLEEDLKKLKMCPFRIGLEKPLGFLGLCKEFSSLKQLSLFKKLRLQICGDRIAV